MISEKLLNTKVAIENYEIEKDKKDDLEDLKNVERKLNKLVLGMDTVSTSALKYETDDFEKLNTMRKEFKIAKLSLTSQEIKPLISSIYQIENNTLIIDESLKSQWNRLFSEKYKSKINLLKTLYSVIDDIELVKIRHSMEEYGKKEIINENHINDLKILEDNLDEKIKSLNLNHEIELFLNKLVKNQATLEDINEVTLGWLKQKEILDKIHLTTSK